MFAGSMLCSTMSQHERAEQKLGGANRSRHVRKDRPRTYSKCNHVVKCRNLNYEATTDRMPSIGISLVGQRNGSVHLGSKRMEFLRAEVGEASGCGSRLSSLGDKNSAAKLQRNVSGVH